MLMGLILALVLTIIVFGGATEPIISGVALLAFALGWAMLAWLSIRRTDQPQRWAFVPAIFMGVLGLAHLVFRPSDAVLRAFGWVWPIATAVLAVWLIIQSRRSLHSWSRRGIIYPVVAVLLLAAVGGAYETIRESMDESAYAMPGQLIDVGGHKLHISCTGSGSPTVILEAGLGQPAAMMSGWIQPGVATVTRVCVYDRAGMGWSEPTGTPRDGVATATDLHTLLHRAEIDGPYVLAGHSSGGVYAQVFAAQYPDEVAGLVLLDSQPPDAIANLPGYAGEYEGIRRFTALFPSLARLGVGRLAYPSAASGLPPEAWAEARALMSTGGHNRGYRDDAVGLEAALTQAQALTSLGGKPLIVVTAVEDAHAGWLPLQEKMAGLSTNGVQRVIQDASHASLIEDEGDSANAIDAILDVVDAVRSGGSLQVSGHGQEDGPALDVELAMVMMTLPLFRPVSTYRWASRTCSSG
jgi:pimeloyl-ACP methyl ester carboxylesterase